MIKKTLSPSKVLLGHLDVMLRSGVTKKQLIEEANTNYAALNKLLRGESVNFQAIRLLQRFEVDTRPDKEEVLEGINRLISSGIAKRDISLKASMGRPSLEDFINSKRVSHPIVLRKLDYAINELQTEYEYRIEVHNLLVDVVESGVGVNDISKASGISYRGVDEIVYEGVKPRKTTVKKLHEGLLKLK